MDRRSWFANLGSSLTGIGLGWQIGDYLQPFFRWLLNKPAIEELPEPEITYEDPYAWADVRLKLLDDLSAELLRRYPHLPEGHQADVIRRACTLLDGMVRHYRWDSRSCLAWRVTGGWVTPDPFDRTRIHLRVDLYSVDSKTKKRLPESIRVIAGRVLNLTDCRPWLGPPSLSDFGYDPGSPEGDRTAHVQMEMSPDGSFRTTGIR